MDNGILQSLIEQDFGYKSEGQNWGRAENHSSLVVNEKEQKWYWNSENMGGTALDYLIKVRGLDKKKATELLDIHSKISMGMYREKAEEVFFTPYEKLVNAFWEAGKENRQYWYDRNLKDSTIDRHRLGFYHGWYILPLYLDGRLINFQKRRDLPEKKIGMWYREEKWTPVLLNKELLNLVDKIYITEGTVDALLLTQEGIPAVAQTGGAVYWSPVWYPFFYKVNKVYYIADNDKAGVIAARRIAKSLGIDRTFIYRFSDKQDKYDSRDFFREGGTAKEFKELVEGNAKTLSELGVQL